MVDWDLAAHCRTSTIYLVLLKPGAGDLHGMAVIQGLSLAAAVSGGGRRVHACAVSLSAARAHLWRVHVNALRGIERAGLALSECQRCE